MTAPGAPTDPDVQDCCIRLVGSELRCVGEHITHPPAQDVASLASFAIRCSFVETVSELGISTFFPFNGSLTRRSSPSTGFLGWVPPLPRYDEALRLPLVHPGSLVCLVPPVPSCAPCSLSLDTESVPTSLGFGQRLPSRILRRRRQDLPGSWGILANVPRSQTPVGRAVLTLAVRPDVAFRLSQRRRPPRVVALEAQSRSPLARCLRFAGRVTPARRKTRYRPAGWALAGRDFHPLDSIVKFQVGRHLPSSRPRLRLAQ